MVMLQHFMHQDFAMMNQFIVCLITLWLCSPTYQFQTPYIISGQGRVTLRTKPTSLRADTTKYNGNGIHRSEAESKLLQLAQSHFVGQALYTLTRLGVMDVLQTTEALTVDEIIAKTSTSTSINREALFRCLRLVCTSGVVGETVKEVGGSMESAYFATDLGVHLRTDADQSMAPFILHWLERPLWDAWSQLPSFVENSSSTVTTPPFDRANGMSAADFYSQNKESCSHRNSVARYASSKEITSIIEAMKQSTILNEAVLSNKVVVDVGGGYGDLLIALRDSFPTIGQCHCLDLPHVIKDAASTISDKDDNIPKLVAGNMFDPTTIPPCDIVFIKHVLCDFSDEDVVQALLSFRTALDGSNEGKVVIMDAALPNGDDLNWHWDAAVSFDVLLMLSGRRGERSRLEWKNLATRAGFVVEDVLATPSVTVDLTILKLESTINV